MNKIYSCICPHCSKTFFTELDKEACPPKEPRHIFGEESLVKLRPVQYQKLLLKFGKELSDEMVQELEIYIGKKKRDPYRDHYLAILDWPKDKVLEKHNLPKNYDIRLKMKSECQITQEVMSMEKGKLSKEEMERIKTDPDYRNAILARRKIERQPEVF